MMEFDEFYAKNVKFGLYHKLVLFFCVLSNIAGGTIFMILPFCVKTVQYDFMMSWTDTTLLTSSLNFGGFVGLFLISYCLEHFGRKNVLTGNALIGALLGVALYFSTHKYIILLYYAVMNSVNVVASSSNLIYVSETLSGKHKGKLMVLLYSGVTLGKLFGSFLIWYFLDPYQINFWKLPLFISSIIASICFIGFLLVFVETIAFSFHHGNVKNFYSDLTYIFKLNSERNKTRNIVLFDEIKPTKALLVDEDDHKNHKEENMKHFVVAFKLYLLILCSLSSTICQIVAFSYAVGTDSKNLFWNIVVTFGEVVGAVIASILIDNKRIGKRRLIIGSHCIMALTFILINVFPDGFRFVFLFIARICVKMALSTSYIYMGLAFPIHLKGRYVFRVDSFMNLSAMFLQILFFKSLNVDISYMFGLLSLYSILGSSIAYFLPSDLKH